MFPYYKYNFQSGPVQKSQINNNFKFGNCRLAIQLYFYHQYNLYLPPNKILLPEAYKETGSFIAKDLKKENIFEKARTGDIIYAERLKNSKGKLCYKKKTDFKNEDEWILYFHTAIYLNKISKNQIKQLSAKYNISNIHTDEPIIWHASSIDNGTCFWNIEKFLQYYQPKAIKRILSK